MLLVTRALGHTAADGTLGTALETLGGALEGLGGALEAFLEAFLEVRLRLGPLEASSCE